MNTTATVHIETTGGCDLTIYAVPDGPKPATRAGVAARESIAHLKGQGEAVGRVRIDLWEMLDSDYDHDNARRLKTWELDKITNTFRQTARATL